MLCDTAIQTDTHNRDKIKSVFYLTYRGASFVYLKKNSIITHVPNVLTIPWLSSPEVLQTLSSNIAAVSSRPEYLFGHFRLLAIVLFFVSEINCFIERCIRVDPHITNTYIRHNIKATDPAKFCRKLDFSGSGYSVLHATPQGTFRHGRAINI